MSKCATTGSGSTPSEGPSLEEYAASLARRCPGLPAPEELCSDLRNMESRWSKSKINLELPCTDGPARCCHMLGQLSLWNEFLCFLCMEVKEEVPGKLGVFPLYTEEPRHCFISKDHACFLLHWLITQHRCIRTLQLNRSFFTLSHQLLCDALRASCGIERLELHGSFELTDCASKDLLTAVASLRKLEVLVAVMPSKVAFVLDAPSLGEMQSLTQLEIRCVKMTCAEAESMLLGLKGNRTISQLHVDNYCLLPGDGRAFGEYLEQNTSLEELTMESVYGNEVNPEPFFGALRVNRVLCKLALNAFNLNLPHSQCLVEVMAENTTLHRLHIQGFFDPLPFGKMIEHNTGILELVLKSTPIRDIIPFADAVRRNKTMEKLTLSWRGAVEGAEPSKDAVVFLEALASNTTLKTFTMECMDEKAKQFYKALESTRTVDRVSFRVSLEHPETLKGILEESTKLSDLWLDLGGCDNTQVLCSAFEHLASCHWLTEIAIRKDECLKKGPAVHLARLFSSSKVLKSVYLRLSATAAATRCLLEGLSKNKSIASLKLNDVRLRLPEFDVLKAMLDVNTTLHALTLFGEGYTTCKLIMSELPRCLVNNHSLVSVHVAMLDEFPHAMFKIQDRMRLNSSFQLRAVKFVMGDHQKSSAIAFEQLSHCDVLVGKLRYLTHESECEARKRIAEAKRHLAVNFMAVAGIVKEEVVCAMQSDGQTQLDQIGLDNWLRIQSYLKVSDILDAPVGDMEVVSPSGERVMKRKLGNEVDLM